MIGRRRGWEEEGPDKLNPWRFLLLVLFIGGVVVLIWWAHGAGYIKQVDDVPPPPTAPKASTAPTRAGAPAPAE